MSLKYALNENTLIQCGIEEFIKVSAEAGFNAVELSIPKLKEALYHMPAREISGMLKKYGLSVLTVNALEDAYLVPEENLSVLEAECELVGRMCKLVECPAVIAPVARWFDSYGPLLPPGEFRKTNSERLSFMSKIFRKYGVQVVFEPIGYPEFTVRDLDLSQEIIEASGETSVGLAPDIHNLYRSGVKPAALASFRFPVSIFHINDTEGRPMQELEVCSTRTFPGEGVADAKSWVQAALDAGYQGYFSLELFRQDLWDMDSQEAADLCYRKLKDFDEGLF